MYWVAFSTFLVRAHSLFVLALLKDSLFKTFVFAIFQLLELSCAVLSIPYRLFGDRNRVVLSRSPGVTVCRQGDYPLRTNWVIPPPVLCTSVYLLPFNVPSQFLFYRLISPFCFLSIRSTVIGDDSADFYVPHSYFVCLHKHPLSILRPTNFRI